MMVLAQIPTQFPGVYEFLHHSTCQHLHQDQLTLVTDSSLGQFLASVFFQIDGGSFAA